ncbi:MAG TPA: flagellar biosynthetic protein FliR, partial [Thermomicrobiales bacterium]|nr:flagellar biosynthetic protein FliR [Thermomicrobiales bacterium]
MQDDIASTAYWRQTEPHAPFPPLPDAGALAVMVCACTPLPVPPALFSVQGMLIVAGEVLVGIALGFVLQLLFAAPTIAAEIIGGTMGMSMASAVDPH